MSTTPEFRSQLEEIAAEAARGRAIWRVPEVLAGGLPTRRQGSRTFQGVNVLVLWHALRSSSLLGGRTSWARWVHRPQARAVVAMFTRQANPPLRIEHWVSGRQAQRFPLAPDRRGLGIALKALGVLDDAAPTPELLATGLARLAQRAQHQIEPEQRSRAHVWLRRSLRVEAAEHLLLDLATSYMLAWAELGVDPPALHTLPHLEARHLPRAAHVAWRFSEAARGWLERYASLLWPDPPAVVAQLDVPLPSERTARRWVDAVLPDLQELLDVQKLEKLGLGSDLAARAVRWAVERPQQVAAWMARALTVRDGQRPGRHQPLQLFVYVVREAAQLPPIVDGVDRAVGGETAPPELRAYAAGASLVQALRTFDESAANAVLVRAAPSAESAWARARRMHTRATWVHHLGRLTLSEMYDAKVLASVAEGAADGHVPKQLADVIPLLVSAPLGSMPEPWTLAALSPMRHDIRDTRSLNRELRHAARRLRTTPWRPEHTGQLPLFGPPAVNPATSWGELLELLNPAQAYRAVEIPKRGGRTRRLHVPSPALARAQRRLGQILALYFPGTAQMTAFMPGRSVAWHARTHAGARHAVTMDIEDFFGSVRPHHLAPALRGRLFWRDELAVPFAPFSRWSEEGIAAMEAILFMPGDGARPACLAQGAPSSPIAANLGAVPMDRRVCALARAHFGEARWSYSRYADDLVLSTPDDIPDFAATAERLMAGALAHLGWSPNRRKTRAWSAGRAPLVLCGVKVPESPEGSLEFPRETSRRVRVAAHRAKHSAGQVASVDLGLLAFAYAVTGDPSLMAWQSRHVRGLAAAVAGPLYERDFLLGWCGT